MTRARCRRLTPAGPEDSDGATKYARTRARILDAAAYVLSRQGYAGTRLSDVAERANIQTPAIYYYFPSKEDLFLAVIEAPYARLVTTIGEILNTPEPVRDRVRALFRRIGAFTPDEAETFRLVLGEALKSPKLRSKGRRRQVKRHRFLFPDAVARAARPRR